MAAQSRADTFHVYHPSAVETASVTAPNGVASAVAAQTVFVVDDDADMRDLLSVLVASAGLRVETFSSAAAFLETYDRGARSGCLVCDVRLPGMSGLDLQRELAARRAPLPVIMISGCADLPTAVSAMRAGALDFIEKPFGRDVLLARVQEALERERRARVLETQRRSVSARVARLSPRERQVMDLVVAGKANKVIAMDLGLCEKTVEVHRARVMRKMEAGSLAELVRLNVVLRPE